MKPDGWLQLSYFLGHGSPAFVCSTDTCGRAAAANGESLAILRGNGGTPHWKGIIISKRISGPRLSGFSLSPLRKGSRPFPGKSRSSRCRMGIEEQSRHPCPRWHDPSLERQRFYPGSSARFCIFQSHEPKQGRHAPGRCIGFSRTGEHAGAAQACISNCNAPKL